MNLRVVNKVLFVISIAMLMAFTASDTTFKNTSVTVTPESSLLVRGTTNINTFTCGFNVLKLNNPIEVVYKKVGNRMVFEKTALILDNDCFDCGGKGINSDFQKILKSNKYPQISLFLNEISDLEDQSDDVLAALDIEIAGISKRHKVPVKFKKNKGMLVTGDLAISMSDYNLKPPKKLFGLISVHDTIEIYFQLAVREN
ncbi:YceI family protein [Aestuariivivens insulae]|uniref:YceI family protein n=1 Tax=Aestuariivivens insulae TaxID=1621988 RepID=UPI001F58CBBA|nr:YceI family protein [Aestuariivivens insulae]